MADDSLSLLFRMKADAAGVLAGTQEAKAAVASLRSHFGGELASMSQISKGAFGQIGEHIHANIVERIPLVGGAFLRVTENLHGLHDEAKRGAADLEKLGASITAIAGASGKTTKEVGTFLTSFVHLEGPVKRDAAAVEFLGASLAGTLTPELEKAGRELITVGESSAGATGGLAAFGGVAGVVTVALLAVAAATVGAGIAIFEVVKKSAEAGLELEHLKEQTGLTAKTITALKFASDESGKSIEGLGRGMKLFELLADRAANGSKKAEATLKALGTTSHEVLTDLDGSLAKVFKKIDEADNPIAKAGLAAAAFGKRIGPDLIPLIEAFHGDLGELIKRAEELGVTLDEQGIKSLAEFQKNMNALQAQAAGLARTFAVEVAPLITDALKGISKALADNKDKFKDWGTSVSDVMRGTKNFTTSMTGGIIEDIANVTKYLNAVYLIYRGIKFGIDKLRESGAASRPAPADPDLMNIINANLYKGKPKGEGSGVPTGGGGKGDRKKEETEAHKLTMREIEEEKTAIAGIESASRQATDELKHAYQERLTAFSEYISAERAANIARMQDAIQLGVDEQAKIREAFAKKTITRKEYDTANNALNAQLRKDNEEYHKKTLSLDDEEYKERLRLAKEYRDDREKIDRDHEDSSLQIVREGYNDRLVLGRERAILESQLLEAEAQVEVNRNKRKKQALEDEINDIAKYYAEVHKISLQEALTVKVVSDAVEARKQKFEAIEAERVEIARRTAAAIIKAQNEEALAENNRQGGNAGAEGSRSRIASPLTVLNVNRAELVFGAQLVDVFQRIRKAVHDTRAEMSGFKISVLAVGVAASDFFHSQSAQAGNFSTMMQSAAMSIVGGLGDLAKQWVLTGHVSALEMRKMVANMLASLTQQAVMKALWEAAEAVAEYAIAISLAANPFTAALAPGHFAAAAAHTTAAAAYGLLAAGAGIAGRVVAGGAFQDTGGGASGGGASGGSGSTGSSSSGSSASTKPAGPTIINAARNDIHFVMTIRHEQAPGFHSEVVKSVVKDVQGNGAIRSLIIKQTKG